MTQTQLQLFDLIHNCKPEIWVLNEIIDELQMMAITNKTKMILNWFDELDDIQQTIYLQTLTQTLTAKRDKLAGLQ